MADRKVTLTVEGKVLVDADVTRAREKIASLGAGTLGSGAPVAPQGPSTIGSGAPVPDHPTSPLSHASAGYFNALAERTYHAVSSRLSTARTDSDFRGLSDRIEQATYNATQGGNKELVQHLSTLKDEIKRMGMSVIIDRRTCAEAWKAAPLPGRAPRAS